MTEEEKQRELRILRDEITSSVCNTVIAEIIGNTDDYDSLKPIEQMQVRILLRKQLKLTTK